MGGHVVTDLFTPLVLQLCLFGQVVDLVGGGRQCLRQLRRILGTNLHVAAEYLGEEPSELLRSCRLDQREIRVENIDALRRPPQLGREVLGNSGIKLNGVLVIAENTEISHWSVSATIVVSLVMTLSRGS